MRIQAGFSMSMLNVPSTFVTCTVWRTKGVGPGSCRSRMLSRNTGSSAVCWPFTAATAQRALGLRITTVRLSNGSTSRMPVIGTNGGVPGVIVER